jgi:hypothetical protein
MTTRHDLGFEGADVFTIAFQPGSVRLWFGDAGTYLEVSGVWRLTWPDGSVSDYDTGPGGRHPDTPRLMDALAEAHIVSAHADIDTAVLDVEFDSGLRLHYEPTGSPYEEWQAQNRDGRTYVALPNNELTWFPGRSEPAEGAEHAEAANATIDPGEEAAVHRYRGDDPRVIDLEIAEHIYGITVYSTSVQLETRDGSVYIAGPFTVFDTDGESFPFDPAHLRDDPLAGALLSILIDHRMGSMTLVPETSELTVTLAAGGGLRWKASTPGHGQFSAKLRTGRQFWSRGDGTVYWYGGHEGTHPKFLVGGPKESD